MLTEDGKIVYALKLEPMTFLERLRALIPRPRVKLITYHGVFASAAGFRDRIVPQPEAQEEQLMQTDEALPAPDLTSQPRPPEKMRKKRERYSWAELLRRVFPDRSADRSAMRQQTQAARLPLRSRSHSEDPRPPRPTDRATNDQAREVPPHHAQSAW